MNISKRDRLMVLMRIPEYSEDFSKWKQLAERVKNNNKETIDNDLDALKSCEKK